MCISPKIFNYKAKNSNFICKEADTILTKWSKFCSVHHTISVLLVPKRYNLNFIMRKYQTNPNWGVGRFYTKQLLLELFKNLKGPWNTKEDEEMLRWQDTKGTRQLNVTHDLGFIFVMNDIFGPICELRIMSADFKLL